MSNPLNNMETLAARIKAWGADLGFQQVAITDTHLDKSAERLNLWLDRGYQGDMMWMADHGSKRWMPGELVPGTTRIISARMNYLATDTDAVATLRQPGKAYISRYALGRDYHKLIRKRLAQLGQRIEAHYPGTVHYRPFVDSAPVLEKPLAEKAGIGWMGKHTLILNSEAGSWFFLGEIYINLPLPVDEPQQPDRCGNCSACLNVCPTDAFPAPYQLDARRCISYLTIEHKGEIPESLRPLMGNRVFGCDDCQLICPWNRYAKAADEGDFKPRHGLADADLITLFNWSETEFEEKTAGSPIRRIGYERWQRNLAVGLGNAAADPTLVSAMTSRLETATPLVRSHIEWALDQQLPALQQGKKTTPTKVKPFPPLKLPF
jgi:epoxyqueuosine reductase